MHLGPTGSVGWSDRIDMCGDALYLEITGLPSEEKFPALVGQ